MNSEIADLSTDPYLPSASEYFDTTSSLVTHGNDSWLVRANESYEVKTASEDEGFYPSLSPWCISVWKRAFDLACTIPALILISPLLGFIAVAVRLTSPGPAIFRQVRTGWHRRSFTIYKFRTMVENSETIGPGHTAKGDPRVTPLGRYLRRLKLDELPQLYNVLFGDMSLVGPRPKLPNHDPAPMACRPGVTGAATLAFRYEARILGKVPAEHIEDFYQQYIVPLKSRLDSAYMERATVLSDLRVLFATVLRIGGHVTHEDLVRSKQIALFLKRPVDFEAVETSMSRV